MKKHAKKYRVLPKFEKLPERLQKFREAMERGYVTSYARFYGVAESVTGIPRRFSFQVILEAGLNGQEMYRIVREIVGALLQNRVPVHEPGQVFTLSELEQTRWVTVRKVLEYEVDMIYD